MAAANCKPLTILSGRLSQHIGGPAPGYRYIWNAVVNGELLMIKRQSGRWFFDEADVPAIANALGLVAAEQSPRPTA